MGLPGLSDIVDRSLTSDNDRMYLLEPMSAEPIASLCESDQQQPASSASPQYTPRLNFEGSQIAAVMLMMPGNRDQTRDSLL